MLRERETWMTAFCYWVILVMLIGFFVWRWLPGYPSIMPVVALVAMPASVALAIYGRRVEAQTAKENAALRAAGRFEDAAAWQKDGFYVGWTRYRLAQAGVALLLALVGLVLVMPLVVFLGVCAAGFPLWWAYRSHLEHRQDIEHRRTSKQRIGAATDGLEESGWNDR